MAWWRGGVLMCLWVAGCGGSLADELAPTDGKETEASLSGEERPGGEPDCGDVLARWCRPEVGTARRVKRILPPTQTIPRYAETPESLVEFRGRLHFAVNFEDGRMSLWRSDGTASGTVELEEFPPLPPAFFFSRLGGLTPTEDRLFFTMADATHGHELWVTEGARGGARRVVDLTPGVESSLLSHLAGLGRTLVFIREVPETTSSAARYELWRSDGTAAGTVRLRDFGETSVSWRDARLGDTLLFFLSDATRGTELWKTDGTAGGTALVSRLDAGPTGIFDVLVSGRTAFFTLNDADGSTEVWRTDGSAGGTVRLDTLGPGYGIPRPVGSLGRFLYLAVTDASEQRLALVRLRVEGGGRERVVTLPNRYASEPSASPYLVDATVSGGKLFLEVAISSPGPAPRDTQLWVSDGTQSGTTLLRRPLSLSDEYNSPLYAAAEGAVFFSAYEEASAGIEPWVTDGTVAGTRRLKDVAPGGESSYPRSFTRVGDRVFFSAFDDTEAGQLWSVPLRLPCVAPGREPARPESPGPSDG